jgi:putative transposase
MHTQQKVSCHRNLPFPYSRNQGLEYRTPNVVYESGKGGGAMIVDKYGSVPDPTSPEPVPALDAGSAGEHEAPPQTPPCREQSAMTATLADG